MTSKKKPPSQTKKKLSNKTWIGFFLRIIFLSYFICFYFIFFCEFIYLLEIRVNEKAKVKTEKDEESPNDNFERCIYLEEYADDIFIFSSIIKAGKGERRNWEIEEFAERLPALLHFENKELLGRHSAFYPGDVLLVNKANVFLIQEAAIESTLPYDIFTHFLESFDERRRHPR